MACVFNQRIAREIKELVVAQQVGGFPFEPGGVVGILKIGGKRVFGVGRIAEDDVQEGIGVRIFDLVDAALLPTEAESRVGVELFGFELIASGKGFKGVVETVGIGDVAGIAQPVSGVAAVESHGECVMLAEAFVHGGIQAVEVGILAGVSLNRVGKRGDVGQRIVRVGIGNLWRETEREFVE